ncbi:hypothetical protein [Bradyrhizobium sp. 195]|uniref:hypothetical protein n=1 Tax=Bradyrhizobium sp. 195 TaxID=2782662 RepID=UPI002000995C|nr:hypothetical protein [Bradyrhizobium sp. 195]
MTIDEMSAKRRQGETGKAGGQQHQAHQVRSAHSECNPSRHDNPGAHDEEGDGRKADEATSLHCLRMEPVHLSRLAHCKTILENLPASAVTVCA